MYGPRSSYDAATLKDGWMAVFTFFDSSSMLYVAIFEQDESTKTQTAAEPLAPLPEPPKEK